MPEISALVSVIGRLVRMSRDFFEEHSAFRAPLKLQSPLLASSYLANGRSHYPTDSDTKLTLSKLQDEAVPRDSMSRMTGDRVDFQHHVE